MPSLQVREMPTVLYGALQRTAKREHRSLAQQAVVTLARGLDLNEDQQERRRELLDDIRKGLVCSPEAGLSDPAGLVREDRDR
jgi:antitoxin FitA